MAEQRDVFDRQQQLFEREQIARTAQAYDQENPSVLDAIEGMQERLDALTHHEEDDFQRHVDRTEGMSY